MDDASPLPADASNLSEQKSLSGQSWLATLSLQFAEKEQRTYLARRQHLGPLVIQKTLHPEGAKVCHGIIVHPPGGVAGGDQLELNIEMGKSAHVLLTTPGAGKWYKANQRVASQHVQIDVQASAQLEWFPQENILFDGADVDFSTHVRLQPGACYSGWDVLCFGRQARGERWHSGQLRQRLSIYKEGRLIWHDRAFLKPDSRVMQSLAGLGGNVVSGGFVVAAGSMPKIVIEACQQLTVSEHARCGVTALPEIFSARYIGQSSQEARHYFEQLWHILRPWYAQREATRPRIWNT